MAILDEGGGWEDEAVFYIILFDSTRGPEENEEKIILDEGKKPSHWCVPRKQPLVVYLCLDERHPEERRRQRQGGVYGMHDVAR